MVKGLHVDVFFDRWMGHQESKGATSSSIFRFLDIQELMVMPVKLDLGYHVS